MGRSLIIDEDSVYEIDEMCMKRKEEPMRMKSKKMQEEKLKEENLKRKGNRFPKTGSEPE